MTNDDPILTAIQRGGVAVADDDPILSAIQGTPSASSANPKKSRAASPKVSAAPAEQDDPILDAIIGQNSNLRTPTLDELATGASPETQTPSLTDRAAKVGRSTIPLGPPKNLFVDTTQIPRNVFTGDAQQPGMATEEEKARWRASLSDEKRQQLEEFEQRQALEGSPYYGDLVIGQGIEHLARNVRDIAGDVSGLGPQADPSQSLTDVTGFVPPESRREHPYATAVTQAISGLGSPENASLMVASAGMSSLPALARAGISAYFAAQMAKGAYDQVPGIQEAWARGDMSEVKRLATLAGVNVLMGAAAGAHGIKEAGLIPGGTSSPFAKKGTISESLARDEAAAPKMQTIGAGESLAPETQATLKAQTDALAKGTNKIVYFPKGQGNLPEPPENATVTVVPGEKQGAGTYYHDDSVTPEQIKGAVEDGSYAKFLGYTQSKEAAIQGKPAGVVARDASGTELKAGLVDSSNPQAVAEQAAAFARQFPESKIGVESAENVIASRQAPTAKQEASATETPLSPQTPAIERRSATSEGTPPQGMAERRGVAQMLSPVDETTRLQAYYDSIIKNPQSTPEDIAKAERAKAETNPSMIGGGGEETGRQIREARAKESGKPMSMEAALANEAARKAKNQPDAILDAIQGTAAPGRESRQAQQPNTEVQAQGKSRIPRTPPGVPQVSKGESVRVRVTIPDENNNPTYLRTGEYELTRQGSDMHFRNVQTGSGTSERLNMLTAFAKRGSIRIEPIEESAPSAKANKPTAPVKQQSLAGRFSPATLEEARQELTAAHQLASSFERPGRYFPEHAEPLPSRSTNAAKGDFAGGSWYGIGSSKHIVAEQFPWYGEIEQGPARVGKLIEKGKGAEYERLLGKIAESIQREKASAAPVLAEFAPRLRELSEKIDGNDQELSDSLAQLANSDGRGFKNLKEYIQGKIHDADQARTFYALVDKAATEARQTGAAESPESRGELRAGESGRATRPGAETPATSSSKDRISPALNEAAQTPEATETYRLTLQRERATRSTEAQNALPGMDSAVEEQRTGAARVRGERLGEEANRPLGSIEETAGRMERESPLFRDSEANPQSDLFKSKPLESATPAVGERIQPTTGPLKGQTVEVTKVGETGVYARAEDGGPIKFVKNGEFEAVRYSGIHPKAMIEGARVLQRAWQEKIAQPFIDRVLKIGDKYRAAREADPAVAEGLHLLDNAPTYLRAKAAQVVKGVIGNLSRAQERLFTLMADADSRENLRMNHPEEFVQAQNDPAIQKALGKYRPLERELTTLRERMGGQTLEQDYLRRVYDKYVAGVNKAEAPGTPERGTSAFDRVIRPQRTDKLSRESTSEYHYENGLHEFGPAFATKFIATHLKALRDQVAREFLDKATMLSTGAPEPRSIEYNGQRYYRPDVAKELREAGAKDVKMYDRYDPTAGEKFPVPVDGKYLGPRDLVKTLTDFGRREESEPGALRRFFQEQILGFGFGVPHIANIMRRVSQTVTGGVVNPAGWARAWKVVLSKELRDRGVSGLDDPTFDMLAKHGAISTGEVSNLKAYMGGNLNPANWASALAQVGHKFLFEPTAAKGFGGLDQRARLYVADLVRSQRPDLSDAKIAEAVRTQLGDYNRANWTDQQKMLSKFMMFPGWDFSSVRWVLQHPIKTTMPPALVVLLANRTLNYFGQNREEDRDDISAIHIGDRDYSTSLLRESVARNLFRPVLNFAQSKLRGESNQRAFDAASRGITAGAGGLLSMLRPDLSGFLALATNRQALFGGKEIVSAKDWDAPGKILPSKALEKQAVFTLRHALPALDRMLDSSEDFDWKSFVGGNLGVPNSRDDAEKRLIRNAAEANRVYSNISKLAKTDPEKARELLKEPDNAAYALFHHDLTQATTALRKIDQVRETVDASKMPDADKQKQLKALDNFRQMFLGHADGLNNLLFKRRTAGKAAASTGSGVQWGAIPRRPPAQAEAQPQ
jgi:hypothetical protein